MVFTLNMPKLSPTMEEGSIVNWLKKEGDFVAAGEVVVEIATDKATVEHQALDEGWLRKILVPNGKMATLNQPLAIFSEEKEASIEELEKKLAKKPAKKSEPTPSHEEPVTRPEVPTGYTLQQPAFVPEPPLTDIEPLHSHMPQKASPLARKLAKQRGLDLTTAKGSGPMGRVTSEDLKTAQPKGIVTFDTQEEPSLPGGSYEEIALTPMRKAIGKRLQEAKSFIPHFYVQQTLDAEPLVQVRAQLKHHDLSITINDLIIRASALALRKMPAMNRGFHSVNQTLIQFQTIDISLAVTVEGGLITPIIRHADYKSVGALSLEVRTLAERAKQGKLKEHEYKGGSFCVSNLGMFGISNFTAVLNPPQAAILAVGGIEEAAVVREGKVVPGKTMTLTLSADHRVIDGALAAKFLKEIQTLLENPAILLV